ncbi:hypothetical protein B296_00012715 [Ensete ventricosum]|uniref:Uncharacterized protein n=1 Tax=Ensete ventricosum TaxID=4639 RepID=A0A426YHA0_ENSVE|nr:hypothetical protein B296_00012715 [Ensete ventricosum]
MVDMQQLWPPPPILLPPSAQEFEIRLEEFQCKDPSESRCCLRARGGHLYGHLQRGGLLWPTAPAKGRPDVARASPQGATPARDQIAGAAARRWSVVARRPQGVAASARSQGRPTVGTMPAGRQPMGKGTAHKGCHLQGRLLTRVTADKGNAYGGDAHGGATRRSDAGRRGGSGDDAVRVREEG